jgi:hypothetical protein
VNLGGAAPFNNTGKPSCQVRCSAMMIAARALVAKYCNSSISSTQPLPAAFGLYFVDLLRCFMRKIHELQLKSAHGI